MGLKVGWNQFFSSMLGVRGYLAYDFDGTLKTTDGDMTYQNISLNVDAMFNFINNDTFSMSVFVGVGLGWGINSFSNKSVNDGLKQIADYNGFNIPN